MEINNLAADSSGCKEKIRIFNTEKHFYIYGTMEECQYVDNIIAKYCCDVMVDGYTTNLVKDISEKTAQRKQVISLFKAQNLLRKGNIDGIIAIARTWSFYTATGRNVDQDILKGNYYIVPNHIFRKKELEEQDIRKIFTLYRNTYRAGTLQFLVTQKCNLNCKLCSHFAPLVKTDFTYGYEQYVKDLRRMRELLDDVDEIGLWGGEALLCPGLERYIYSARKIYPYSRIVIGTNGLLIRKMSEELIEAIRSCNAILSISLYPPTLGMIEDIKAFLEKNRIEARYPYSTKIEKFFRRYDLSGNNDIVRSYQKCGSKICTTVFNGKISACYFPIVARTFNKYFGKGFEVDEDIIDIYCIKREEILTYLREPMASCRYCGDIKYEEWEAVKNEMKIEDWVL